MIRFLTAGESHGKGLTTIVEGFPSNIKVEKEIIDFHLARRQMGYGRGGRMKIEKDKAEILSGIRFQKTLGSPISLWIENKDWANWIEKMDPEGKVPINEKITLPRPGHADLVGVSKYNLPDIRNSIERSSARETAARVAAGSIARIYLEYFGITIGSFVESIGGVYSKNSDEINSLFDNNLPKDFDAWKLSERTDLSSVRVFDQDHEDRIVRKIKSAKKKGDTLGGTFITVVSGLPVGLGSFVHYDTKLDADLAHTIMSINAVKGVEIGTGFKSADSYGSESHDIITLEESTFSRGSNRAGGIEGGISTGLPIIIRGAMKPIATLMSPINAVDLSTMEAAESRRERSDFVAVPACAVIAESMVAWTIAEHIIKKFGGDSIEEALDNYKLYNKKLFARIKKNFK